MAARKRPREGQHKFPELPGLQHRGFAHGEACVFHWVLALRHDALPWGCGLDAGQCTVSVPYAGSFSGQPTPVSGSEHPEHSPTGHIESGAMARLDLRIPDELKAALTKEAERQDLPAAELAREAIAFYVGWLEAQRQPKKKP